MLDSIKSKMQGSVRRSSPLVKRLSTLLLLATWQPLLAEPVFRSNFPGTGTEDWKFWVPPGIGEKGCAMEISPTAGPDKKASLQVRSDDFACYGALSKSLPVQPGQHLKVTAWVRGGNDSQVAKGNPGAFIRLALSLENGKPVPSGNIYISSTGTVATGLPLDTPDRDKLEFKWAGLPKSALSDFDAESIPSDWTKIEAVIEVPAEAARMRVDLMSYRTSGSIFWDNIQVEEVSSGTSTAKGEGAPSQAGVTVAVESSAKPEEKTVNLFGHASVEELMEYAMQPITVNTSPLPAYGRLDYGMTIGIERTPKGRIWACWVGGGDNDKAFFVLATSDDDGATWSKPRAVVDPHDDKLPLRRSALVGTLWTDPKGRLWLFFNQSMSSFDGRAGSWYTICENPDSDNPAWSKPERIWHGMTLNKPIVRSNGEWILPISLWHRKLINGSIKDLAPFPELDEFRGANVFASTDEGKTWVRRGIVKFPSPRFDEHMFVERKDGSLWMTARTRHGIWESTSADGGKTWSEPAKSPIINASTRHFIRRLQSGNIIMIKHGEKIDEAPLRDDIPFRSHLAAFLSEDDGQTWKGGLMLDERVRVSYPDGFQAPDGTIYISWDRERNDQGEILMAKFTEKDILAKDFVTPGAQTKMLISKPDPEAVKERKEREALEKDAQQGEGA